MTEEQSPQLHECARVLPTGKRHISPSEISQWSKCSWAHNLSQVQKLGANVPNVHSAFGHAVHETQESFLRKHSMDRSIAHASIDAQWELCGFRTKSELEEFSEAKGWPRDADRLREITGFTHEQRVKAHADADHILDEVPSFMDATFPHWEFIAAETELYEPIGDTGVFFKGFIDGVIVSIGKRDETLIWIIDWKTTSWGWHKEKKQDPLVQNQLVLYKQYWMQKIADPKLSLRDVRCAFVLLKRTSKVGDACELLTISVGDVAIERAKKRSLSMIESVSRGKMLKNRQNCTFCEHRETCVGNWVDRRGQIQHVSSKTPATSIR